MALWFAEWYTNENKIDKKNIAYCLCTEELKCPDLIGSQSPTNYTEPGKELIEWTNGYLTNAIEKGGVVILDSLEMASSTVTERLNGLLDQKFEFLEQSLPEKITWITHGSCVIRSTSISACGGESYDYEKRRRI